VDRHPELAASNNALCTTCHQSIGKQVTAHTRHRADSAGSSCVECHMPTTVISIKSKMRDHTMSLPAPENTVAFGIPNACTECHRDKNAAWAVDVLEKWWPQGRRGKLVTRAEAFTAARAKRPDALGGLLAIAGDDREGPLIRANAVGYLRGYEDPRAIAVLLEAAKSDHPAIRAMAISSMALSLNAVKDDRRIAERRGARAVVLAALDDPVRSVRISALLSLIILGDAEFSAAEEALFRRASREFEIEANLHQDDASNQGQLGLVLLFTGEYERAASALTRSLILEPDRPGTKFLLGLARLGQGRREDARALLKEVPASDPNYQTAQERLKELAQPGR
jgi:tetratricopeptide (TPR) repeat protein